MCLPGLFLRESEINIHYLIAQHPSSVSIPGNSIPWNLHFWSRKTLDRSSCWGQLRFCHPEKDTTILSRVAHRKWVQNTHAVSNRSIPGLATTYHLLQSRQWTRCSGILLLRYYTHPLWLQRAKGEWCFHFCKQTLMILQMVLFPWSRLLSQLASTWWYTQILLHPVVLLELTWAEVIIYWVFTKTFYRAFICFIDYFAFLL